MGMFITVTHAPLCPYCRQEMGCQSKDLSIDGIAQPLDLQEEALRPGVTGNIYCWCDNCHIRMEASIFQPRRLNQPAL